MLLRRRGLLAVDAVNNEADEPDALRACGNAALQRGRREKAGPALALVDEDEVEHGRGGMVARAGGLNLYASAVIDGSDRERLERICRYLLRGPIALGRLRRRDDGMLTYRLKKVDRRGNTAGLLRSPGS